MLRNKNFVLLWISQCISGAGDTFTFLALTLKVNDFYADPGARDEVKRLMKEEGFVRNHEVRIKKADGEIIWMLFNLTI